MIVIKMETLNLIKVRDRDSESPSVIKSLQLSYYFIFCVTHMVHALLYVITDADDACTV